MATLDPRAPLVVDTRDLGRRPGHQQELERTVPAPADLGIEVLKVPEGAPVELELRLEAVVEGVLVTGDAFATLEGDCVRCLEPVTDEVDVHFQELFLYARPDDDEDEDLLVVQDDMVDLEPVLRDAIVLGLPFQPLCRDDCRGLCTECGANLNDDPEHGHDAPIDPRWAGLTALTGDEDPE
jgi:uncharacterized protein